MALSEEPPLAIKIMNRFLTPALFLGAIGVTAYDRLIEPRWMAHQNDRILEGNHTRDHTGIPLDHISSFPEYMSTPYVYYERKDQTVLFCRELGRQINVLLADKKDHVTWQAYGEDLALPLETHCIIEENSFEDFWTVIGTSMDVNGTGIGATEFDDSVVGMSWHYDYHDFHFSCTTQLDESIFHDANESKIHVVRSSCFIDDLLKDEEEVVVPAPEIENAPKQEIDEKVDEKPRKRKKRRYYNYRYTVPV